MTRRHRPPGQGPARWIIRVASRLVPPARRPEWLEEWEAELWHWGWRNRINSGRPPSAIRGMVMCLGAVSHALWEQKKEWSVECAWQDVRYAFRQIRRSPGFTVVAVATLGLGIGANTTIFSLLNALLLRPPPGIHRADRLVQIARVQPGQDFDRISYPNYVDLRNTTEELDDVVAYLPTTFFVGGAADTELIPGEIVTGNYFHVLGVAPALGRTLQLQDDLVPGAHPVVVISHRYWQRVFGGNPAVVGRALRIGGQLLEIIGVAAEGFVGTEIARNPVDAWVPMMMYHNIRDGGVVPPTPIFELRGRSFLRMFGRLRDGATPVQARAELQTIAGGLRAFYGDLGVAGFALVPGVGLTPAERSAVTTLGAVLIGAVAVVLLITCANVTNLLLVRGAIRAREIGVRMALGAGRGRVIRQLLTESFIVAVAGGVAAFLLAFWTAHALPALLPQQFSVPLVPDVRVFMVTLIVAGGTAIVFGIVPAWRTSQPELASALREGGRGKSEPSARLRSTLVVAQLALSLILLIGAGLLLRSVRNAQGAEPGYDTANVLLMSLNVARVGYQPEQGNRFYADLIDRVRTAPGVRSAALARTIPIAHYPSGRAVRLTGEPLAPGQRAPQLRYNAVTPDFFRTLGMPIVRGRGFTDADRADGGLVVVVNQRLAEQVWPGEDPIGKSLYNPTIDGWVPMEVVGVVRDARMRSLRTPLGPFMFVPFTQKYDAAMTLHVRTEGDPLPVSSAVLRRIEELDAAVPVYNVSRLRDRVAGSLGDTTTTARLITTFGLLAMVLAAVGLYGVVAYTVEQRQRELGIRIALGANSVDVVKMVVGQGIRMALLGVGLGLVGAVGLTRLMRGMLYDVTPTDPATLAAIAVLLTAVAMAASYLPARRAARVDPLDALRSE
ncbi:MAG: ABC transporter permease [Gemmatimonadetes bacterium]|nr:ABC transporter permease [Gemmatimonadota bacterium]